MKTTLLLALLVLGVFSMNLNSLVKSEPTTLVSDENPDGDDDHTASFSAIVRSREYPFEQHKIKTYDGYFLTTFRIPGMKGEKLEDAISEKRPVVLLWHGLLDSADSWVINDEDKSPAFVLANQGYDVWVANSRGNKYSREHRYLDPDRPADQESFFGFNIEDMANHDTNSTIKYILAETGKRGLGVIGHGMGATQFFLAPQSGIEVLASLGGMSILNSTEEKLITTLAENDYLLNNFKEYKIYEAFPENFLSQSFFSTLCENSPTVCQYIVEDVMGVETDYINMDRIDEMLSHYPAGTSLENMEHFVQIYKNRRFQKFDYGLELNRRIYNRDTPPEFDLSDASSFKVIQMVGEEDHISTPRDSHWLREQIDDNLIYYGSYRIGHYSFLLGKDMSYLNQVITLFKDNEWR